MSLESASTNNEGVLKIREGLKEMKSPLCGMIGAMSQDRSLERIDLALNAIGEPWSIFNLVTGEEDSVRIFEKIKEVTNLDDQKEAGRKMAEICREIDSL